MEKRTGGRVSIRCAHGDVVSYALANVNMEIGGQNIQLQVGVAPNLPVPVLLGTDAPELSMLLRSQLLVEVYNLLHINQSALAPITHKLMG